MLQPGQRPIPCPDDHGLRTSASRLGCENGRLDKDAGSRRRFLKRPNIAVIACLGLPACMANIPLHERPADLRAGEDVWCLAPNGTISASAYGLAPDSVTGAQRETCAAPARFVRVPVCRDGQPAVDETPAADAARARLALDGSLHGDGHGGRLFCIPVPPS